MRLYFRDDDELISVFEEYFYLIQTAILFFPEIIFVEATLFSEILSGQVF